MYARPSPPSAVSRDLVFSKSDADRRAHRVEYHGITFVASGSRDGLIIDEERSPVIWCIGQGPSCCTRLICDSAEIVAVQLHFGPNPRAGNPKISYSVEATAGENASASKSRCSDERLTIVAPAGGLLLELKIWADTTNEVRITGGVVFLRK